MKRPLIIVLLLTLASMASQANHIAGGGILWQQIGIDTFKITVEVYRDCNGSALQPDLVMAETSCGTKKLYGKLSGGFDITPVCGKLCTRCSLSSCSFQFGLQKYTITTMLYAADWRKNGCCQVDLSWWQCCRPNTITTGGARENLYYTAELNICDTVNNSSPVWARDPNLILCLGREDRESFYANPVNNSDSLVFSFAEPLINASKKVYWKGSYSFNKPLTYLGFPKTGLKSPRGIELDSFDGSFRVQPMTAEVSIINIKVEIYRNGKYSGNIVREHCVYIIKCPSNSPPVLSDINCATPSAKPIKIEICSGESLTFSLCAFDSDSLDTVRVKLIHDIKGAQQIATNTGSTRQGVTFSWTPDSNDARTIPYKIIAEAYDDACPINGKAQREISIYVNKPAAIKVKSHYAKCGEVELSTKNPDSVHYKFGIWNINGQTIIDSLGKFNLRDSLKIQFKEPGVYHYSYKATGNIGCVYSLTDSFVVPDSFLRFKPFSHYYLSCINDTIGFEVATKGQAKTPLINWSNGTKTNDSVSHTKFIANNLQEVLFMSANDGQCQISDSILIETRRLNSVRWLPDSMHFCSGQKLNYTLFNNAFADKLMYWFWTDSKGAVISAKDSSIEFAKKGEYYLQLTDSFGCKYFDTTHLSVAKTALKTAADTTICQGDSINLWATSSDSGTFNWYFINPNNSVVDSALGTSFISKILTEKQIVKLHFEPTGIRPACPADTVIHINVMQAPNFSQINAPEHLCFHQTLHLNSGYTNTTWNYNGGIQTGADFSYNSKDSLLINSQLNLQIVCSSTKNCKADTNIKIFIAPNPKVAFTLAAIAMSGVDFTPVNQSDNASDYDYSWHIGNPVFDSLDGFHPIMNIDSIGTFKVLLRVTTPFHCSDTVSHFIAITKYVGLTTATANTIKIYPNPANEQLFLGFENSEPRTIRLFATDGKLLLTTTTSATNHLISIAELPVGTYYIQISSESENYSGIINILR
ncbi:T9SS type A sorting domain-containing protein [bacterium]|nr:T9SS type A sorting domain-containing protein [bacterium]